MLGKLVSQFKDDDMVVSELYLRCLAREPNRARAGRGPRARAKRASDRAEAFEDILWGSSIARNSFSGIDRSARRRGSAHGNHLQCNYDIDLRHHVGVAVNRDGVVGRRDFLRGDFGWRGRGRQHWLGPTSSACKRPSCGAGKWPAFCSGCPAGPASSKPSTPSRATKTAAKPRPFPLPSLACNLPITCRTWPKWPTAWRLCAR